MDLQELETIIRFNGVGFEKLFGRRASHRSIQNEIKMMKPYNENLSTMVRVPPHFSTRPTKYKSIRFDFYERPNYRVLLYCVNILLFFSFCKHVYNYNGH